MGCITGREDAVEAWVKIIGLQCTAPLELFDPEKDWQ